MLTIPFPKKEWCFHLTNVLVGFLPYMDIFLKEIFTTSLVPKSLDLFPVFPVHQISTCNSDHLWN